VALSNFKHSWAIKRGKLQVVLHAKLLNLNMYTVVAIFSLFSQHLKEYNSPNVPRSAFVLVG
jgi:hypothetical protein